jgi:hypothetical protein
MPAQVQADYLSWPLLPELFPVSFPGVKTSRDEALVDIDRERLAQRMQRYFDPALSHAEVRHVAPRLMESTGRFQAEQARDHLLRRGFLPHNVVRYCYRPFDLRWLYWEPETDLLDRGRPEYKPHVFEGNLWIEARQRQTKEEFDRGYVVRVLADNFGNGLSSFFPLYLAPTAAAPLFAQSPGAPPAPNLSPPAAAYLGQLEAEPSDLFFHAAALMHAPAYRRENGGALRQDWPRLPLPADRATLLASAALGRRVADLLDPERAVPGVTAGAVRPELAALAVVARVGGANLDPAAGDLALSAGWGYAGQGGVTMPGLGRVVEREYTAAERAAIQAGGAALQGGAAALGMGLEQAQELLGRSTCDVYLNDVACWGNVPAGVWAYTLGGYQVLKKWLSYRERALLGRDLKPDEVVHFVRVARRIAALLLMQPELDENYRAVKESVYAWPPGIAHRSSKGTIPG